MIVTAQDNHITVGAWAACEWNQNFSYTAAHLCFTHFAFWNVFYSEATLSCTKPILKEATFPSTGLSCKTGRMAGNQPRRKWLLVMEQSRETLSCTFWSKEGKCWNVDMKTITGNYVGFDCCVQTCIWLNLNAFPSRVPKKSPTVM